jgi:hypothetical protein
MTADDYIAAIETASGQAIPPGHPHRERLASQFADLCRMIRDRDPALLSAGLDVPDNKARRRLFADRTGIALPKGVRASLEVLERFLGEQYAQQKAADREAAALAEAEAARKQEAEREAERMSLGGFMADATPMARAKAKAALTSYVRYNGEAMPYHKFVEQLIAAGSVPQMERERTERKVRGERIETVKEVPALASPAGTYVRLHTVTAFKYAQHIKAGGNPLPTA